MPRLKGQTSASSWPDIHIETLRRLWAEGKTGSQIADVIPYSRCAVCAKARRLGLEDRPRNMPRPRQKKRTSAPAPAIHTSIVARMEKAIDMVADYNFPLREAAEKSNVPFHQLRGFFTFLLGKLDMGEPASVRDDVVRPRHA